MDLRAFEAAVRRMEHVVIDEQFTALNLSRCGAS
jgi:hypothetical protein